MMRAILIKLDHAQQCVSTSEVTVTRSDGGGADLDDLYGLLACHSIDIVVCEPDGPFSGHVAIMDDNGLDDQSLAGFLLCDAIGQQPYAGHILLMKEGAFGETESASIPLEIVSQVTCNSYVSRDMARAAMIAWEEQISSAYPDAIVVRASMGI